MKKLLIAMLMCPTIFFSFVSAYSNQEIFVFDGTSTLQLTDNWVNDSVSDVNSGGDVVWSSASIIFLYDGTNTFRIADPHHNAANPQINDNGDIVWCEYTGSGYEIVLYDGSGTTPIPGLEYFCEPIMNNNRQIVCKENSQSPEIFFYNGTTVIQLTDGGHPAAPDLSENGEVVWFAYDGSDYEIFLFDGTNVTQISDNNSHDSHPQINSNGDVVWQCGDDSNPCSDEEDVVIFLYDGATITQISEGGVVSHRGLDINDNGDAVWIATDGVGSDSEVFLYDGDNVTQITDNSFGDLWPRINNSGHIVWTGYPYVSVITSEIFLYDGTAITQITSNDYDDESKLISDNGDIVWNGNIARPSWGVAAVTGEGRNPSSANLNYLFFLLTPIGIILFIKGIRKRN